MSSDDASDDSDFDKEAEREKLREKYGEDEQDRENTRRMSELLLQGATMTGKHCNECGDPIFRYDGQEFCPTCQHAVQAQQGQAEQAQAQQFEQGQQPEQAQQGQEAQQGQQRQQSQQGQQDPQSQQTQQPQDAGRTESDADRSETAEEDPARADSKPTEQTASNRSAESDDEPRVEIDGIRVADQHTDDQSSSNTPTQSPHADSSNLRRPPSQQGGRDEGARGRRESSGRRANEPTHGHARTPDRDADLATARESLVRKLTDLAHRAEETEDVARTRELLAATREAAEALAALDRANR